MMMKASYTVEAAIIVPLFLFMICSGMKIGINIYQEITKEKEQEIVQDLWLVDEFYKFQILKEVKE